MRSRAVIFAFGLVPLDGLLAAGDAGLGLASVELGQAFRH